MKEELFANQAMAVCNSLRTSPRKLNLVAQSIRGLNVEKAVAYFSATFRHWRHYQCVFDPSISAAIIHRTFQHYAQHIANHSLHSTDCYCTGKHVNRGNVGVG